MASCFEERCDRILDLLVELKLEMKRMAALREMENFNRLRAPRWRQQLRARRATFKRHRSCRGEQLHLAAVAAVYLDDDAVISDSSNDLDVAGPVAVCATLPLPTTRAGKVTTEHESIAGEAMADAVIDTTTPDAHIHHDVSSVLTQASSTYGTTNKLDLNPILDAVGSTTISMAPSNVYCNLPMRCSTLGLSIGISSAVVNKLDVSGHLDFGCSQQRRVASASACLVCVSVDGHQTFEEMPPGHDLSAINIIGKFVSRNMPTVMTHGARFIISNQASMCILGTVLNLSNPKCVLNNALFLWKPPWYSLHQLEVSVNQTSASAPTTDGAAVPALAADEKFVLKLLLAVVVPSTTMVALSSMNVTTTANCLTNCPSSVINTIIPAVLCACNMDYVGNLSHVSVTFMAITVESNSIGIEVHTLGSRFGVNVTLGCRDIAVAVQAFDIMSKIVTALVESPCAGWPPSVQVQLMNMSDSTKLRPIPWPSFIMGDCCDACWKFYLSMKGPGQLPIYKVFRYLATVLVGGFRCYVLLSKRSLFSCLTGCLELDLSSADHIILSVNWLHICRIHLYEVVQACGLLELVQWSQANLLIDSLAFINRGIPTTVFWISVFVGTCSVVKVNWILTQEIKQQHSSYWYSWQYMVMLRFASHTNTEIHCYMTLTGIDEAPTDYCCQDIFYDIPAMIRLSNNSFKWVKLWPCFLHVDLARAFTSLTGHVPSIIAGAVFWQLRVIWLLENYPTVVPQVVADLEIGHWIEISGIVIDQLQEETVYRMLEFFVLIPKQVIASAVFRLRAGMFKDVQTTRKVSTSRCLVNFKLQNILLAICLIFNCGVDVNASASTRAMWWKILLDNARIRPRPWPNFMMSDMGSATSWYFSWSSKPPWPHTLEQKQVLAVSYALQYGSDQQNSWSAGDVGVSQAYRQMVRDHVIEIQELIVYAAQCQLIHPLGGKPDVKEGGMSRPIHSPWVQAAQDGPAQDGPAQPNVSTTHKRSQARGEDVIEQNI